MANRTALVVVSGVQTQISSADDLLTGAGLRNQAGNLVITPTGSDVQIAAAKNLSAAAGAGQVDFSLMTGSFKTATGAVTIGGSGGSTTFSSTSNLFSNALFADGGLDRSAAASLSIGTTNANAIAIGHSSMTTTITGGFTQVTGAASLHANAASDYTTSAGDLTLSGFSHLNLQVNGTTLLQGASTSSLVVQAGVTLSTTGSGMINLPSLFQINGSAVSANVTATNLGTLTASSTSDASALHTHNTLPSPNPQLVITGLTTSAMTGGTGQAGYVSANNTFTPTDNAAMSTARFGGIYEGTSGQIVAQGVINDALMTTAGGSPSAGAPVYLAAAADDTSTGAGKLTATAPTAGGSVVQEVGICLSNANYAGSKTAKILIQPKTAIQL